MYSEVATPPESGYPMFFYQTSPGGTRVVMLRNKTEQVVATCTRITIAGKTRFNYSVEASDYTASDYTFLLKYFGSCNREVLDQLVKAISDRILKMTKNETDRNNSAAGKAA